MVFKYFQSCSPLPLILEHIHHPQRSPITDIPVSPLTHPLAITNLLTISIEPLVLSAFLPLSLHFFITVYQKAFEQNTWDIFTSKITKHLIAVASSVLVTHYDQQVLFVFLLPRCIMIL